MTTPSSPSSPSSPSGAFRREIAEFLELLSHLPVPDLGAEHAAGGAAPEPAPLKEAA